MSDDIEGLCFEDAFEALEAAVRQLEEGNLTLEETIVLYQRGMRLARRCSQALDEAELRVQELAPSDGQ